MPNRTQAGFTFTETLMVTGIFLSIVTLVSQAFATSSGVVRESRAALHASEELRRNLDSIANRLRGAASTSLTGFTASTPLPDYTASTSLTEFTSGSSTALTFQYATGVDGSGVVTLDAPQTMRWESSGCGEAAGGQIVVVRDGVRTPIARGIPPDGLRVTLLGRTLCVHLTTTYLTSQGTWSSVSGEVSVSLRN